MSMKMAVLNQELPTEQKSRGAFLKMLILEHDWE